MHFSTYATCKLLAAKYFCAVCRSPRDRRKLKNTRTKHKFPKNLRGSAPGAVKAEFFRHYAAGVHAKVVSEMLGHARVAITMDIYAHVLSHMQDRVAVKVGSLLHPEDQKTAAKATVRKRELPESQPAKRYQIARPRRGLINGLCAAYDFGTQSKRIVSTHLQRLSANWHTIGTQSQLFA